MNHGSRVLSLPLDTNDGMSMLCYDFLMMNPAVTRSMAAAVFSCAENASYVRITTERGTNLKLFMRDRRLGLFN